MTTVFDHHASYGAVTGSLSEVSRAADELGLRACLGYEVSDREGESKCRAAIQENVYFIREISRRRDGMRRGMMGMHAGFTLSDRTLEACMEACRRLRAATSTWPSRLRTRRTACRPTDARGPAAAGAGRARP